MSEAKIVLTAADQTKAAFDSVKGSLKDLNTHIGALQAGLASLAGAIGVAALAGMVANTVKAAAALTELSTITGASVESLSKFSQVAKLSGTDVDAVATAMNKLAKNMAGVTEDGKGAAAALRAIGVDFNTFQQLSPDEKMLALSKALEQFSDGSDKSAVAMTLLGREGARLLPFMRDLAIAGDLNAKVTTQQAAQSLELEKNIKRLFVSGDAWKKELVAGMTPALSVAAQAFTDLISGTNGMRDGVRDLVKNGSINDWTRDVITGLSYVLDGLGWVKRGFQTLGQFIVTSVTSTVEFFGSVGQAMKQFAVGNWIGAWKTMGTAVDVQKSIWKDFGRQFDETWGESTMGKQLRDRIAQLELTGDAGQKAKKGLRFGSEDAESLKQWDAILKGISERTAGYKQEVEQQYKLSEGQKFAIGILDQVRTGTLKLDEAKAKLLGKMLETMLGAEKEKNSFELDAKAMDEAAKAHDALIDKLDQGTKSIQEELQAQLEHNTAMLSGKEASAELAAAKLEDQAASLERRAVVFDDIDFTGQLSGMYRDQAKALRDLAAAKREGGAISDQIKEFKNVFTSLNSTAKQLWDDMWQGGSNVFKRLTATLKSTLLNALYEMTAQKWLINVAAAVTGTTGSVAQAAVGNTAGSGLSSAFGSALGGIGAAISGGYAAGATGSTAFATSLGVGNAGLGASGLAEMATVGQAVGAGGVASGIGGAASSALASIPVYGWVALAALAAYSLFSKKGGGPKTESGYGAGVPTRGDAAGATQIGQAIQAQYGAIASAIGIKDTSLSNLGVFYAQDPKGTAQTQLQIAGGSYDRASLYGGKYENVGRSEAEFQQAVALAGAQLVVKNLQEAASGKIGDFLKSFNITTDSLDSLQQALQISQDVGTLDTALAGMGDSFASLRDASVSATEAFIKNMGGMQNATAQLSSYFNNFYSDTDKHAAAARQIASTLNSAGLGITQDQVLGISRDQFRQLVDVASADPGSTLYAALLSVNQAFADITPAAQGAADSLNSAGDALAGAGKSLWEFTRNLGVTRGGTASPQDQLDAARSAYVQDQSLARAGSPDAYGRLQDTESAYIDAAKLNFSSGSMTQAIIDQIRADNSSLPAVKSYDQQQLDQLTSITASINQLGPAVDGGASQVTAAIAAQSSTMQAQMADLIAQVKALQTSQQQTNELTAVHAQITATGTSDIVAAVEQTSNTAWTGSGVAYTPVSPSTGIVTYEGGGG